MRTPPCPPPERPDSKDRPVPGDYHIEHAIGIRVLQRVAVRVDRQVDPCGITARLLELVLDAHWGILPSLIRTAFAKGAVPSLVNPVELMVYRFHIVFARTGFSIGSRGPDRAAHVKGTVLSPGRPAVSPARPVLRPQPTSESRGSEAARCAGRCVRLRPSRSARRASGTAGRPRTPSVRSLGSQARIGACSWPRRVCSLRGRGCPLSTPGGPRGDASRPPRRGPPGSLAPRIGR